MRLKILISCQAAGTFAKAGTILEVHESEGKVLLAMRYAERATEVSEVTHRDPEPISRDPSFTPEPEQELPPLVEKVKKLRKPHGKSP